jgi:hypothetical protein
VNKIRRALRAHPDRQQTFRVWVDPIASRYAKADEAVEVIANNALRKVFGQSRTVDRVFTRDSKETASIQLCDVLLGAVLSAWEGKVTSSGKLRIQSRIAEHVGGKNLCRHRAI